MAKEGTPVAAPKAAAPEPEQPEQVILFDPRTEFIVQARCIAKKGCQQQNFTYRFNETFPCKLQAVDDERTNKKIRDAFAAKKKRGSKEPLSALEYCRAIAPPSIEVLAIRNDPTGLPPPVSEQVAHPALPSGAKGDPMSKHEKIAQACQSLDHSSDHHWTDDKKPSPVMVEQLISMPVTAAEIAAAAPDMRRRKVS